VIGGNTQPEEQQTAKASGLTGTMRVNYFKASDRYVLIEMK
jgi:hypothetical protein